MKDFYGYYWSFWCLKWIIRLWVHVRYCYLSIWILNYKMSMSYLTIFISFYSMLKLVILVFMDRGSIEIKLESHGLVWIISIEELSFWTTDRLRWFIFWRGSISWGWVCLIEINQRVKICGIDSDIHEDYTSFSEQCNHMKMSQQIRKTRYEGPPNQSWN